MFIIVQFSYEITFLDEILTEVFVDEETCFLQRGKSLLHFPHLACLARTSQLMTIVLISPDAPFDSNTVPQDYHTPYLFYILLLPVSKRFRYSL